MGLPWAAVRRPRGSCGVVSEVCLNICGLLSFGCVLVLGVDRACTYHICGLELGSVEDIPMLLPGHVVVCDLQVKPSVEVREVMSK